MISFRKFSSFGLVAGLLLVTGAGCISFGNKNTAAGPMGMFRSTDKGETWAQANTVPTVQGVKSLAGVKALRFYNDPSDPNTYYLTTQGSGVFYTYNKGDSWQHITGLQQTTAYGIAVDPKDKCNIYIAEQLRVMKTTDCGRTWAAVYTEQRPAEKFVALTLDTANSTILYGALHGGDLIISQDSGGSWRTIKRFDTILKFATTDPQIPGRVYVGTATAGGYRSDDGGTTWTSFNKGLSEFSGAYAFFRLVLNPAQKNSLFWVSKYGVLRSDDGGTTWKKINLITPEGSVNIYAFAVNPVNQKELYYTGTTLGENSSRSTFYKSVDGGVTWITKKLPTNTIPVFIEVNPKDPNLLFMAFTNA